MAAAYALIGRRLADDQHPVPPLLPQQVLGERVGAHGPVRRDVEHVAATLLLAQRVVAGAHVEDERVLGLGKIGDGEEIGGFEVGDDDSCAPAASSSFALSAGFRLAEAALPGGRSADRAVGRCGCPLRARCARPGCLCPSPPCRRGKAAAALVVLGEVDDRRRQRRRGSAGLCRRLRLGAGRRARDAAARQPQAQQRRAAQCCASNVQEMPARRTFRLCYNLSSSTCKPARAEQVKSQVRARPGSQLFAAAGRVHRRLTSGAARDRHRTTVRIQAMIFHTSWSLSISSPNGGIGPTTPSVPLRA